MTIQLNEALVARARRKPREDTLTDRECVALNLFWRKNVKVPIFAKVFKVSKNTIYYRALTGSADSYPTSIYSNNAKNTNKIVDEIGVEAAWHEYVTDEMVQAVEAEILAETAKREAERQ